MKKRSSFLMAGVALTMVSSQSIAGGLIGDIVRGATGGTINIDPGGPVIQPPDPKKLLNPIPDKIPGTTIPTNAPADALQDGARAIGKGAEDGARAIGKGAEDGARAIGKGAEDGVKTYVKAWEDTADAGKAVAKFTEKQLKGTVDSAVAASDRIREGKIADAVWHFSTDPLKKTSDNAAAAAAESEVLRAAGAVAASAYGGPAGAAAYAAWYTYSQTKNLNLALKAGLIAGAMSVTVPVGTGVEGHIAAGAAKGALAAAIQGGDADAIKAGLIAGGVGSAVTAVGNMPAETTGEAAKKALVAGAVGGIAVAAAGGDKEAVKKAFLKAGGSVVVQYAHAGANTAAAKLVRDVDTHCMSAIGANCTAVVATVKETAATVQNVKEQIKGVANEQFAISWTENVTKEGNIVPSVVLTYNATLPHPDATRKPVGAEADAQASLSPPHDPTTATALPPVVVTTSRHPFISMRNLGDSASLESGIYELGLQPRLTTTFSVLEGALVLRIDGVGKLECSRGDQFRMFTRGFSTFEVQIKSRSAQIQTTALQIGEHLGRNCKAPS